MVFRTNTAYDRWWEPRKILGALVNTSTNLALKFNTFSKTDDSTAKKKLAQLISSYVFSMKNHLRTKLLKVKLSLIKTPNQYLFASKTQTKPNSWQTLQTVKAYIR